MNIQYFIFPISNSAALSQLSFPAIIAMQKPHLYNLIKKIYELQEEEDQNSNKTNKTLIPFENPVLIHLRRSSNGADETTSPSATKKRRRSGEAGEQHRRR